MPNLALSDELTPIEVSLTSLYLDPNNPRFADFESPHVPDANIEAAQARVQELLIQHYQVDKLRMSMEVNGYLPIDRVVVREFEAGKYVVLEGNRRIAAAKSLSEMHNDGVEVVPEVLDSLKNIPCLQYTGTDGDAAWIFQGLRHITGIREWSSFNKAKLLVEQMESSGLSLTDVGKRFGLTPHGAGQWVRGYYAFKQAKEKSDFISEVHEESYAYFLELFGPSSIAVRDWMDWDDNQRKFNNELNFNEFVSWLYPRPDNDNEKRGDWENRRIARRDDIRKLAYLIRSAPEAFQDFRSGGAELEEAYSIDQARKFEEKARKSADVTALVFDAIETCTKAIENIPWKVMQDDQTRARLFAALEKLTLVVTSLRS